VGGTGEGCGQAGVAQESPPSHGGLGQGFKKALGSRKRNRNRESI